MSDVTFLFAQLVSVANLDELFNFPFYNFLVFSTEHRMAHLVSLDWFVWPYAIIILVLPPTWQKPGLYAMTGVSWIILMTCGAKMQSSVVHLAARYDGIGAQSRDLGRRAQNRGFTV